MKSRNVRKRNVAAHMATETDIIRCALFHTTFGVCQSAVSQALRFILQYLQH